MISYECIETLFINLILLKDRDYVFSYAHLTEYLQVLIRH